MVVRVSLQLAATRRHHSAQNNQNAAFQRLRHGRTILHQFYTICDKLSVENATRPCATLPPSLSRSRA